MTAAATYEFGPYRLDVAARRLTRGAEVIALTPKAFDVLLALIERRDRVVDKSELMKLVWPDSFVEEANLSQTIFVLRKTLGEDPEGRQFIDTIPRRGYRFAATVSATAAQPVSGAARRADRLWIAAGIAAAMVIGSVAWVSRRDAAETPTATAGGVATDPWHTASVEAYRATMEGQEHYLANRLNEAVPSLTRATALDPDYAPAWALLSKTLARSSAVSNISSGSAERLNRDAVAHALRAVQLAPTFYDAHIALALASRQIEDVQRWRSAAEQAIELDGMKAEPHGLLADSYFAGNAFGCRRDRDPARAERHYRMAIQLEPKWTPAYANLAYHFSWLGKEDEALAIAERGLAAVPGNPVVGRARAHALVRLRRLDESEQAVRQVLDAGTSVSGQDHLIMGSIALARGDRQLAAREFATTLARLPSSAFELAIARAYLDNDHLEEALKYLDAAVTRDRSCAHFIATSPAFERSRANPVFVSRLAAWQSSSP